MSGRDELLALADRCEAATGPSLVLERDIALTVYTQALAVPGNDGRVSVWDGNGRTQLTVKPYTASLNAAMTLVTEDEFWRLGHDGEGPDPSLFEARVFEPINMDRPALATAFTPALALCAAALRAKAGAA